MLITRETDYAIRSLRSLYGCGRKTLAEICEEELIPQQFGYKIMKKLAKAGYVHIKRGKDGGYLLEDKFELRTLYDLLDVMETSKDVSPCVIPGYRCEVHKNKEESCLVNQTLSALQAMLDGELKNVRLCLMFE
jgi:Rrf2 family protein